jgi:DNA-binding CsgD family transcriptional regulator/tetratricopeptide (TPR) repeat protein
MGHRVCSPIFVGRGFEAQALESAFAAAGERRPSMTVVAGDAGVGKTRLVREVEAQVLASDGLVLRGECLALSGEFPYAPLVAALRDAARGVVSAALGRLAPESRSEIGRLVPEIAAELTGESSQLNQGRLFERLLALLRHLGDEAPVLFVVEDGHWADASTLDFLSFLTRNLSTERVAAVLTYRPDELESRHPLRLLLCELVRSEKVMSLTLEPLGTAEIQDLIEHISAAPAPVALIEEIFTRSEGNPFFAEELLAASNGGDGSRLPASLRDALLVRCHGLSPDAAMLVRTLAVLGRPAHDEQLGAFAGVEEPWLSIALRSALEAHVIAHRSDDAFEFRHALVGEALCGDLLPGERSALHRAVAEGLLVAGEGAPAELALHWDLAGDPAAALEPSIRAGLDAERVYASAEARQHFERALRLWSRCDPAPEGLTLDRVELLRHTAQVARLMGDWDAAIAHCQEAIALVDAHAEPLRAALLHERAGEYMLWQDEAALACYSTALELLPADCGCERARILGAKALTLHFLHRWEEARDHSREALDEARAAGARTEEGYAANVLGVALAFLGDHAEGERHVRDAMRIAEDCGTPEETARTYAHLAEVLRIRGNVGGALEIMLQGEDLAARRGMENSFGRAMSFSAAEDLVRLGRWDEAAARLAVIDRNELSVLAQLLRGSVCGRLAVGRGAREEARTELHGALELCDAQTPVEYLVAPFAGLAEFALCEDRPEDARRAVADALARIADREEPLYVPVLFWLGVRAEVEIALRARPNSGDRVAGADAAERLCARLEQLAARYTATDAPPEAIAYLALSRAEVSRLDGATAERWTAAVRAWRALEHPLLEAYAGWREAEAVLGSGGSRADVPARLRATREIACRLGAEPLVRRIDSLAKAARIDVSPEAAAPAPQERPPPAEFGLTPRELDVFELLAQGCTNREISQRLFISEKTTSIHVSRILSKVGADNRVRAAAIAHGAGMFDTHTAAD